MRDAASIVSDWRGVVVSASAGLLYWLHRRDLLGGLALGWLLLSAFIWLRSGPDPRGVECLPTIDISCASDNALGALLIAGAALVLAFWRPTEESLRRKIDNFRNFLYRAKVEPVEALFIEENGRGHTIEELTAMQTGVRQSGDVRPP